MPLQVRHTLELYRANYSVQVASLLVVTYLVLQALSIPGTLCINLLIGGAPCRPLRLKRSSRSCHVHACAAGRLTSDPPCWMVGSP